MSLKMRKDSDVQQSHLYNIRLKMTDSGDIIINGVDRWGFKREIIKPHLYKFDTAYIHIVDYDGSYNFVCRFRDFDWSKLMVPTSKLSKVPRSKSIWYAIYDLLAESALYGFQLSGVVDYDNLIAQYGEGNYEAVDMKVVTDIVVEAIHQRDSKQSSELI